MSAPEKIAIAHDDYHAEHVGRTRDGRQFFVTTPFVPHGREFIAVYLFDGDSHVYNTDRPVAAGSAWLDVYDVDGSAENLPRITVDGEANNTNFLEVAVNRPGAEHVLSWQRVPYDSRP